MQAGEKREKRKRTTLRMIALLAAVLCIVVICGKIMLNREYKQKLDERAELLEELEDEKDETEELEDYTRYMKTKKYVEDVARDIIGLVYPDEIIVEPKD